MAKMYCSLLCLCRCSTGVSVQWQVCRLAVATAQSRRRGCWEMWCPHWQGACKSCPPTSDTRSPAIWNVSTHSVARCRIKYYLFWFFFFLLVSSLPSLTSLSPYTTTLYMYLCFHLPPHIICLFYCHNVDAFCYRHEESWGEIQTLFWLWSSNGGGWRPGTIWNGELGTDSVFWHLLDQHRCSCISLRKNIYPG